MNYFATFAYAIEENGKCTFGNCGIPWNSNKIINEENIRDIEKHIEKTKGYFHVTLLGKPQPFDV